jgi:hypothetical protein
MQLYVGNVTKQIYDFAYRLPEQNKLVYQKIPDGEQIRIAGPNLTAPEITAIVGQHAAYGLAEANAPRGKTDPPAGLIYSIGKPITFEQLTRAAEQYYAALNEQGKQLRQEAAIVEYNRIYWRSEFFPSALIPTAQSPSPTDSGFD